MAIVTQSSMNTLKRYPPPYGACAVALAAFVVLTSCAGQTSGPAAANPGVTANSISIGVTTQLTGEASGFCTPIWQAAQSWIDQVNTNGGVNGRKINYTVLDDGNVGPTGLANAKSFKESNEFAVFGSCGSVVAGAIQPYLEQQGIPYLFPYATVRSMAVPPQKNTFLLLPLLEEQGAGLLKYAFSKYGPGSVVFAASVIPGIQSVIDTYKSMTTQLGGTWSGSFTANTGTADFTPYLLQLKAANAHPDYIFSNLASGDNAVFLQQMKVQNYFPSKQILLTSTDAIDAQVTAHADVLNGRATYITAVVLPNDPAAATCLAAFSKSATKIPVATNTLFGCGEAQVLVAALQDAGKTLTRDTFRSALLSWKNKSVSPVLPPLSFSSSFQVGEQEMFIDVAQDGHLVSTGIAVPTTKTGP